MPLNNVVGVLWLRHKKPLRLSPLSETSSHTWSLPCLRWRTPRFSPLESSSYRKQPLSGSTELRPIKITTQNSNEYRTSTFYSLGKLDTKIILCVHTKVVTLRVQILKPSFNGFTSQSTRAESHRLSVESTSTKNPLSSHGTPG